MPRMGSGRILYRQRRRIPMLGSYILEYFRLNTGDKLHLAWTDFILQEAVNIERTLCVHTIDHAKRVERYLVTMQKLSCGKDLVEGGLAVFSDTIVIVKFLGTIDAQADEESMLLE